MTTDATGWNEGNYLNRYPDVRRAVSLGHFPSGRAHWECYGRAEGRTSQVESSQFRLTSGAAAPYDDLKSICDARTWTWLNYEHRGHSVKTQSPAQTREMLLTYAEAVPAGGLIVEIGVFGGASLLHLAPHAAAANIRLVGVDPWGTLSEMNGLPLGDAHAVTTAFLADLERDLRAVLEDLNYDHVELVRKTSEAAAADFAAQSIDLLFIDGGHSFREVRRDLNNYLPKMKRGGAIIGDDFDWPGVQEAVNDFRSQHNLTMESDQRICRLYVP